MTMHTGAVAFIAMVCCVPGRRAPSPRCGRPVRARAALDACGRSSDPLPPSRAAWPVLASGTPWTTTAPGILAPFGGVAFSLDRLGAFFLALVGLTGVPAAAYGSAYLHHLDRSARGRLIHAVINLFLLGMCVVPAAGNVVTLLAGMGVDGRRVVRPRRQRSRRKRTGPRRGSWYAVMTHAGFLALHGGTLHSCSGRRVEFDALRPRALALTPGARTWVLGLALFAFGSKAGLMPLHVWLPRAHPAAPSHASALMSAAMVKLGVYGLIRVVFDLLPPGPAWWGGLVLSLGVATALAGVLYAVAESHIKRVLAYSTIENIGVIFVAIGICPADARLWVQRAGRNGSCGRVSCTP